MQQVRVGGPHIAKNYPCRQRVDATLASHKNRDGEGSEVAALVNALQLLGTITFLNATGDTVILIPYLSILK